MRPNARTKTSQEPRHYGPRLVKKRGTSMAICDHCGTETQLYDTGYPICAACLNTSLAKPPAKSDENIDLTQNDVSLRLTHE